MALAFRIPAGTARVTGHGDIDGIVIDWGFGGGDSATFVFFNEGSASMYTSSGGGVIGAGEHESVRNAGEKVLDEAAKVRSRFVPVSGMPAVPGADRMRFTLLTTAGVVSVEEGTEILSSGSTPLASLGNAVQDFISQVRQVSGG